MSFNTAPSFACSLSFTLLLGAMLAVPCPAGRAVPVTVLRCIQRPSSESRSRMALQTTPPLRVGMGPAPRPGPGGRPAGERPSRVAVPSEALAYPSASHAQGALPRWCPLPSPWAQQGGFHNNLRKLDKYRGAHYCVS